MIRFISVLFVVLLLQGKALAQSALEGVRDLEIPLSRQSIPVYYSEGYQEKARSLAEMYEGAGSYFDHQFNIHATFTLAVLDSLDWIKVSRLPYGLPFVSGPPYVVCLPATNRHALGRLVLAALTDDQNQALSPESTATEIGLFTAFIGFHELGHIYAKKMNLSTPEKWTFEFAATYLAYAYLEEKHPLYNVKWLTVGNRLIKSLTPRHTTLQDFENLYVRVGVSNYAWYQVVFLQRVAELYKQSTTGFPDRWKQHSFPDVSSDHYLEEFEKMAPGFIKWSQNNSLVL